jgi:adenylylsulfate kinase
METKSMTLHVLLITGTVGAGKTSVLLEIGEALGRDGEPYAIVDLDWLAWLRPSAASEATVQGVLHENLAHVARTFRVAGVERLALARAVRTVGEIEAIRSALEPCELAVVRLVAEPAEIARRLGARDTGAHLAEHLAEAEAFASAAEEARIGDLTVATDGRPVASVARQVLAGAGWPAPG